MEGENEMEMEMEVEIEAANDGQDELSPALARLWAAAAALEQAAGRMTGMALEGSGSRQADHDTGHAGIVQVSAREAELEEQLRTAEATIATLRASRRTEPCGPAAMMAREGRTPEAGALDIALRSLSLEQRIAVKAEMMRAGLL